jgi:hypothetical protein
MDVLADVNENTVLQLIAVVLLMAMFGCAVAVLDHWVWARRSDSPSERPQGEEPPIGRPR